mgnify:CR=1 FL=1
MARITLNKSNFFHNLDIIKAKTQSVERIALVLKDNAYGHGLREMAKLASEYGITRAVVRSNTEAETIEEFFEYILVLADIPKGPSKKIRYTINDVECIKEFPKGTLVELKVNTAMNRNGVSIKELNDSIELIKVSGLVLEAIFTHHSCADELNGNYELQKANFLKIKQNAPKGLHFHSCNSAALFREEAFNEDMVRVGIAAYGCLEIASKFKQYTFKPILSLYAKKISSRQISKGDCVGYGATFVSQSDSVVSNYDFGYGDGFLRANSNTYKTPEGIEIAGRISMDNSSFLSDKKEILIFNDAREVALCAKTISYEVLTSLKENIKREII